MSAGKLCGGLICCYTSIDCSDIVCGLSNSNECLCLIHDCCLSCNCGKENLGCGCVTEQANNECCKIGCCCIRCGLKSPDTCCAEAGQCCCIKEVAAFPFNDRYLNECVLSVCCITCAPKCGICVEAPICKALNDDPMIQSMKMER